MTKIVAQNDVILKFTVTDQDGVAVNLTSATIKWSLKKSLEADAVITKTTASGISITNAAGGIFEVTITDTDATDLVGRYYSEAVITDNAGKIYTITNDQFEPDVITYRPIYTEPD